MVIDLWLENDDNYINCLKSFKLDLIKYYPIFHLNYYFQTFRPIQYTKL